MRAMSLTGKLIIGLEHVSTGESFRAVNPLDGSPLAGDFSVAGTAEVDRACELAAAAFDPFRQTDLQRRAHFLERCAAQLLELGDELLTRAAAETGLPRARLEGERARTVGQLRLFAAVVRRGDWLTLRIDRAQPERKPLPRPDLRLRKIPLGPVAVFGASNFPLAFSAAGGDTASALAAGCPVVVKAHPSHPGTSELAASAISRAVRECGLPSGTYSHLSGPYNDLGRALVTHPAIKAVGFTGSRAGGLALVSVAASRAEPIPVFAEMSSINPVIILPGALRARAEAIAAGFITSLTLGAGQFCTNPGLVVAIGGPDLDRFLSAAGAGLSKSEPGQMLSQSISANYRRGVERLTQHAAVAAIARGLPGKELEAHSALFRVAAREFLANAALGEEVFGPSSLAVMCSDEQELRAVIQGLPGQLTATLHLEAADHAAAGRLLPALEAKVGRILFNGWPTGVEVCDAMVHGGPFPATSDSRATSVGTLAIERFLRPVCYQDMPQELLPAELQDGPAAFGRLVDGKPEVRS
jgi:alpha-ketoglutaric semialdehyde dehydrogenase